MKIREAKAIIRRIMQWQFVLMGVTNREDMILDYDDIDLKKYSLQDFINANKKVEKSNKRKEKMQKYWIKKKGSAKAINVGMTLDDRCISAIYTCLHFEADGQLIALYDDVVCVVVKAKYK